MNIVTYSLSKSQLSDSSEYYQRAAAITDELIKESKASIIPIIKSYDFYFNNIKAKPRNELEEELLELLILGVLMKVYFPRALGLNQVQYKLLTIVNNTRKRSRTLKPTMNLLKGTMSSSFLLSNAKIYEVSRISDIKQLHKLILWLEASGEFSKEIKRLKRWETYLVTLSNKDFQDIFNVVENFATWFEIRSEEILGKYTSNVETYLENINDKSFWREDLILRKRARIEYHLNMVGAELMNKAFRQAFLKTDKKVLLLPICMTSPSKSYCQSKGFGRDFKCKGCSSKCQVNKLTVLGQRLGFNVMVIPHESSISAYSNKEKLFDENTGVIGVACVLNLISGGWLLKDMNIPAQCVLLDYCGCKNHWHDKGIPTCINIDKLKEILK